MRLHPEMPLIAFLGLVHLLVTRFRSVLGRGRAAMMVASTIVPWRISRPRSSSIADTSANNAWLNSCPLQPMAEVQNCRLLRNRRHRQINAGKAAQGLAVIERILHRPVGQPIPLLQKVDPQHPLQPDRRPAALALRGSGRRRSTSRGQSLPRRRPGAQPAPSRPETCPVASVSPAGVFRLRKAPLTLHRPVLGPVHRQS